LSAIAVLGLTEEWFMLWWLATLMAENITNHHSMNHSSVKPRTAMADNITNHHSMNHSSLKPKTAMAHNITNHHILSVIAALGLTEKWFML
jgi:D-ribose pyranose/furanose isomerase RbsD